MCCMMLHLDRRETVSEEGAMTRGPNGDAASSDFDQTGFSPPSLRKSHPNPLPLLHPSRLVSSSSAAKPHHVGVSSLAVWGGDTICPVSLERRVPVRCPLD